jgi:hypothetical protein
MRIVSQDISSDWQADNNATIVSANPSTIVLTHIDHKLSSTKYPWGAPEISTT